MWCARQESNLRAWLRRPALYPLSYGRLPEHYITRCSDGQSRCEAPVLGPGWSSLFPEPLLYNPHSNITDNDYCRQQSQGGIQILGIYHMVAQTGVDKSSRNFTNC